MSEDTTTSEQLAEIEGQADTVQVCEGRWRTRNGEVRNVTPTPESDDRSRLQPWWDAEYGQTWGHDGRYFSGGDSPLDLVTYLGPIEPQPEPQAEPQATDYAPPEGWRLLAVGEPLQQADERVRIDGSRYVTRQAGRAVQSHERYIRPIEAQPQPQPEPQPVPAAYTPPEGWQLVPIGEVLNEIYIRPIEIEPEPEPEPIQVREGRWKTRDGEVRNVTPTPEGDGLAERWPWWDAADRHFWRANGRYYFDGKGPLDLVAYLGPIEPEPEPQPQPERQATQYTPPEGWRLVETHEELDIPGRDQYVRGPNRYIRPIEPQPEEQPEPQADTVQVREGRWRTRNGDIRNVTPTPEGDERAERWPWWDAADRHFWRANGRYYFDGKGPLDLVAYLGPIESEPQQEPQPQPADTAIEELRSEVSYVQNLLGSEKRRVAELEELVTSLERQLAVAKAELTIAASVSQQLQIELDAAQQVPADSPELRQLRSDLADMTLDRDQYKDAYDSTFDDLLTTRETTKAEAVEAIVEWLQPVRLVDSPSLANETMQHLPQIMRHLTGLDSHAID